MPARNDVPSIRSEFGEGDIRAELTELVDNLDVHGKLFTVEGNFGIARYDQFHDPVYNAREVARAVGLLRERVNMYEFECIDAARSLVDSYVGGMRVVGPNVSLMLQALDELTLMRAEVHVNNVLLNEHSGASDMYTSASCSPQLDSSSTAEVRQALWEEVKMSGDNPTNSRAVALAEVLEHRWQPGKE